MMRPLRVTIAIAIALVPLAACEDGVRAESDSSRVRDSALAADLELAKVGTGTGIADGRDTRAVTESPGMLDSSDRSVSAPSTAGERAAAPSIAATPSRNASNVTERTSSSASAEGYIGPSCASPALDDQRRCLLGYLARSDAQLDRDYQALISQLKSEAGTKRGAPEPPSVQRLRTAQRAWLVYRDEECRRQTRPQEGPLWAPVRAECLAEYSALRARELQDALAKRKALARETTRAKSSSARQSSRQRGGRG